MKKKSINKNICNNKRFVNNIAMWLVKKLTRNQAKHLIQTLHLLLKKKDAFRKNSIIDKQKKFPNYKKFEVDTNIPLNKSLKVDNYKKIIKKYNIKHIKHIKYIKYNKNNNKINHNIVCPFCNATHEYIYLNNGKKNSQFKCKVCNKTFSNNTKNKNYVLLCPYCGHKLVKNKIKKNFIDYKCFNKKFYYGCYLLCILW